jgi:hypothetical protein
MRLLGPRTHQNAFKKGLQEGKRVESEDEVVERERKNERGERDKNEIYK